MSNLKWIVALLLLGISFAIGLLTGRAQIQGKWNLHKLEMADNAVKASEGYRAKEQAWNQQLQEALQNVERWKDQANTYARLRDRDVRQLRDQLADNERRLSEIPEQARISLYRATNTVLGACVDEYSSLADEADRCVAQVIRLNNSWPE